MTATFSNDPVSLTGTSSLTHSGSGTVNIQLGPPASGNGANINIVGATQAPASGTSHGSDVTIQSGSVDNTSGTASGRTGRLKIIPGANAGSGTKTLVEIGAAGDTPTTATLDDGSISFQYVSGGALTVFVNDGGTIKSLNLSTPA